LWCRFFSDLDKINNFWQQKTTNIVFKQHDPQSVADLNGVAGAIILGVYGALF
jgi:hypothetical protein